ncbi:hypothetical protein Tco_1293246 [Tanacetum coccineum]
MSKALFTRISKDNWEKHEDAVINYVDIKASIDDYYDKNIAHRDHTDKLVEASTSSLDKSNNTISDLYKGLNIITELLKEIKNVVKDDSVINKKITETTESFTKFSTNIIDLQILAPDSQSLGSVTLTLALTHIPANVEGENTTNTATEDPPSHIEGETVEPKRAIPISIIQPTQAQPITTIITHPESSQAVPKSDKGKEIATESDEDLSKRLVPASTIVCPDPDALIPYTINGEARLLAISKTKVIKVVQEKAEKIRLDPRKIASAKVDSSKDQASGHNSLQRKKKKHIELEPETKIPRLECNRTLPEHVPFVYNMVIKEPEHGIFFTDEFGDQAFQRWSDIDKVRMEAFVSYLVAASMVKSPENARFSLKLKKLIAEHLDQ